MTDLVLVNFSSASETRYYGNILSEPSMGLILIKSYLVSNGISVKIFDGLIDDFNESTIINEIKDSLCVGFYGIHTSMQDIKKLCKTIKIKTQNKKIILGGPNYYEWEEILNNIKEIDIVVCGDGENSTFNIIKSIKTNDINLLYETHGIAFRTNKEIIYNKLSKSLPLSNYKIKNKIFEPIKNKKVVKLLTSKGCTNSCKFCSSQKWEEIYNPFETRKQIEYYFTKKVNIFYFSDENFCPPNKEDRLLYLIYEIKKSNIINEKLFLKIFLEPNAAGNEIIIKELSQISYLTVFLGIESFAKQTLKLFGGKSSLEQNLKALKVLRKYNVNVILGYINLHPFITPNEILASLEHLYETGFLSFRIFLKKLGIIPGSFFLEHIRKNKPNLLKKSFSSWQNPYDWHYEYDLNNKLDMFSYIEFKINELITKNKIIRKIYSMIMDIEFFVSSLNKDYVINLKEIKTMFVGNVYSFLKKISIFMEHWDKINFDYTFEHEKEDLLNNLVSIEKNIVSIYNKCFQC